jgi:MFS family permease
MVWHPNVQGIRSLRGNVLITSYMVVCGIAFIMFGYDQAVLGALSSNASLLKHIGVSINESHQLLADVPQTTDPLIIGCVIAIFSVGAILGSITTLIFGYRFGRRWLICVSALNPVNHLTNAHSYWMLLPHPGSCSASNLLQSSANDQWKNHRWIRCWLCVLQHSASRLRDCQAE